MLFFYNFITVRSLAKNCSENLQITIIFILYRTL